MICNLNCGAILSAVCFVLSLGFLGGCGEDGKKKQVDQKPLPEQETKTQAHVDSADAPKYMAAGQKVYTQYCLSCHQANGSGVSRLNPPLKGTEYVLGDKSRLLDILINGSNVGLDVNGETYTNAMPAFRHLSDEETAHVASYIRNSFGNSSTPITVDEVSAFRSENKG